jgi:hypothetical protein
MNLKKNCNTSYYLKPKNLCFLLAFFNMMKYPFQYTFLHKKNFIHYNMLYQWLSTAVIVLLMMGTGSTRNM